MKKMILSTAFAMIAAGAYANNASETSGGIIAGNSPLINGKIWVTPGTFVLTSNGNQANATHEKARITGQYKIKGGTYVLIP
jgi:hypothetical protein